MRFLDKIIHALGFRTDEYEKYASYARDLVLPSRLVNRDKNGVRDQASLNRNLRLYLGFARKMLIDDKRIGHTFVERNALKSAPEDYAGVLQVGYNLGLDFHELKRLSMELLGVLDYCDPEYRKQYGVPVFNLLTSFQTVFAVFAIMVGTHCPDDAIRHFISFTGDPGQDVLFDRLAQKLEPNRRIGTELKISRHYRLLVSALDAIPADQPALVKKFLDGWYAKVHAPQGAVKPDSDGYTGYWSWEAALVVMLFNIDDSSFRDHKYYPDQLVANYRAGEAEYGQSQ